VTAARRLAGVLLLAAFAAAVPAACAAGWRELAPGLELGSFALPGAEASDGEPLHVVRLDPERWELVLLNASAPGEGETHSARDWCRLRGMVAAVNASMFQADHLHSVSLMRTRGHVNNAYVSPDNTVLAFDRRDAGVPHVRIIDRACEDFAAASSRYGTLVQSIRMVSCEGRNVWEPQARRTSAAAIGLDRSGRVLMIHCRRPLPTHDLIEHLLALPLDLAQAMYGEGGYQSQLYVGAGGREYQYGGGFDDGRDSGDAERQAWPLPNVVAARPRAGAVKRRRSTLPRA
jgi:hypothetical protein